MEGQHETRALALVLRAVDYGESDRIVTFFTRELGKISSFARAARKSQKRFGGALEPFNRLRIRFRDRRGDLTSLASAEIDRSRPALITEYDLITRASYLTELVSEVTREREAHPDLFDLLDQGFEVLGSPALAAATQLQRDGWLAAFELKLLSLAGYRPVLDACAQCGEIGASSYRFLPERGSVICGRCAPGTNGIGVTTGTLKILEASLSTPLENLSRLAYSPAQVGEARRLLGAFIRWQLGKELKSARFLAGGS